MAKKKASANNKSQQLTPPQNNEDVVPVEDRPVDAMEAAVIASLVTAGTPYHEAVAQVMGSAKPEDLKNAAGGDPVEEIEPPVIPQKSKDFSDKQVELYNQLENIDEIGMSSIQVDNIPPHIMDWVIRKTLQEAFVRNNPNFVIEDFIILMLKEQRAIDPTKGGKNIGGSSGPKDLYNPMTEKWG